MRRWFYVAATVVAQHNSNRKKELCGGVGCKNSGGGNDGINGINDSSDVASIIQFHSDDKWHNLNSIPTLFFLFSFVFSFPFTQHTCLDPNGSQTIDSTQIRILNYFRCYWCSSLCYCYCCFCCWCYSLIFILIDSNCFRSLYFMLILLLLPFQFFWYSKYG